MIKALRRSDVFVRIFFVVIVAFVICALLAPVLAPYEPDSQNIRARLLPPLSAGHLLGTDHLGRDILSRILFGARVSLKIGMLSVALASVIGVTFGLMAGFLGRRFDDAISWLVNVQLAIPFILLAISVVAVLGPSETNLIIVLALGSWASYARVIRSKTLSLKGREHIEAARSLGAGSLRIMFRHLVPNMVSAIVVLSSFEFAKTVIAEAALSFLGLSPSSPRYSSWGIMLAEGKDYLAAGWWATTIPGLTIMLLVLAINVVGDWSRDRFDPRSA